MSPSCAPISRMIAISSAWSSTRRRTTSSTTTAQPTSRLARQHETGHEEARDGTLQARLPGARALDQRGLRPRAEPRRDRALFRRRDVGLEDRREVPLVQRQQHRRKLREPAGPAPPARCAARARLPERRESAPTGPGAGSPPPRARARPRPRSWRGRGRAARGRPSDGRSRTRRPTRPPPSPERRPPRRRRRTRGAAA